MKRLFFALAASTLLLACGTDEESQITSDLINNPITAADSSAIDKDNLPFFEFEEEVKDFGQITQGESVKTIFKFRNVGKSNLIISSAQGSCGCTVPRWPKEPIKPGERGEIEVVFNSEGKSGLQNKTITLVANTIPNTTVIALKGEILAPQSK
ncbi:MAG TPA: DUF1573 domain-containing protein [Vicingaceae bacterium]|jgi:hypothetical protein|nr:DUF1573 domain-containing protein [Vicingaceae bacterium]